MKILKVFRDIDDYIITIALTGTIVLVGTNILLRYGFNNPITWNEEIGVALYVLVTFFGLSSAMKHNEHISIDYFVRKSPPRIMYLLQWVRLIITSLIILVIFVYLGFQFALNATGQTSILGISNVWIYLSVPLGGMLTLIHLIYVISTRNQNYIKHGKGAY